MHLTFPSESLLASKQNAISEAFTRYLTQIFSFFVLFDKNWPNSQALFPGFMGI
jgi:hypothetical protein